MSNFPTPILSIFRYFTLIISPKMKMQDNLIFCIFFSSSLPNQFIKALIKSDRIISSISDQ